MERWLWFRVEKGLEQRQGGACCHPRVLVSGRELEAVCRMETDCGGRPRRTWGLTGSWRERLRKE